MQAVDAEDLEVTGGPESGSATEDLPCTGASLNGVYFAVGLIILGVAMRMLFPSARPTNARRQ